LSRGVPTGLYNVLIEGQALARDLTLISRNIREFSRVDGLRVENWEA
jgi:tRNA(fMet)-specific endonuclease VapC